MGDQENTQSKPARISVTLEQWEEFNLAWRRRMMPASVLLLCQAEACDPTSRVHLWTLEMINRQTEPFRLASDTREDDLGDYVSTLEDLLEFIEHKRDRGEISGWEARSLRIAGGPLLKGRSKTAPAFQNATQFPSNAYAVQQSIVAIADTLLARHPTWHTEMVGWFYRTCAPGRQR